MGKANARKVTVISWLHRRLCPYRVSKPTPWPQDTATYKGPKTRDIQIYKRSILLAQVFQFTSVSDLPSSLQKINICPIDKTDHLGTCMNLHTHEVYPGSKIHSNSTCVSTVKTLPALVTINETGKESLRCKFLMRCTK